MLTISNAVQTGLKSNALVLVQAKFKSLYILNHAGYYV